MTDETITIEIASDEPIPRRSLRDPSAGIEAAFAALANEEDYRRKLKAEGHSGPTITVRGKVKTGIAPAAEGEVTFLSWVSEDRIPPAHRAFVRRHVDRAARMLGLGHVRIRWFGPALGDGDFWMVSPFDNGMPSGVVPSNQSMTVAFNAGMRGDALRAVIAHEVRHLKQNVVAAMLEDKFTCEQDADAFAAAYLAAEGG